MEVLATDTEQLIKDTAKKVFFVDGNIHATTQDIADAAGINRASIHYYYRNRKQLFDKVFMEALTEMKSKMRLIAYEELPLREKAEKFIDFFFERSLEHPYLELFVITEKNANPLLDINMMPAKDHEEQHKMLTDAIDHEVAKGNMKFITPDHFIITIMSLCSFPFLGKPIIQSALQSDESVYFKLISSFKQLNIMKTKLHLKVIQPLWRYCYCLFCSLPVKAKAKQTSLPTRLGACRVKGEVCP